MTAATPEELETLLEDAVLLHDAAAITALFVDRGVLVVTPGPVRARQDAADVLSRRGYVASVRSVTVMDGLAVVVGEHSVNVSRRGRDRGWRLAAAIVMPTPYGWDGHGR